MAKFSLFVSFPVWKSRIAGTALNPNKKRSQFVTRVQSEATEHCEGEQHRLQHRRHLRQQQQKATLLLVSARPSEKLDGPILLNVIESRSPSTSPPPSLPLIETN